MEVVPLASSRGTSNGPDWKDLAEMLAAFEDINKVRIELCFARWTTEGNADLSVSCKAWEQNADRRVARPLGFVNAQWNVGKWKTIEGLLTFLLYQLDFELGRHELDGTTRLL